MTLKLWALDFSLTLLWPCKLGTWYGHWLHHCTRLILQTLGWGPNFECNMLDCYDIRKMVNWNRILIRSTQNGLENKIQWNTRGKIFTNPKYFRINLRFWVDLEFAQNPCNKIPYERNLNHIGTLLGLEFLWK
jgi:hypothetical protein